MTFTASNGLTVHQVPYDDLLEVRSGDGEVLSDLFPDEARAVAEYVAQQPKVRNLYLQAKISTGEWVDIVEYTAKAGSEGAERQKKTALEARYLMCVAGAEVRLVDDNNQEVQP